MTTARLTTASRSDLRGNDLTGRKFGKLTVLHRDTSKKYNRPYWVCQCECGNIHSVKGSSLVCGTTKSCGCLKNRITHGDAVNGKRTRLASIYHGMISRCYNANIRQYDQYGGRGIMVCDEWRHDYPAFKSWALSHGYNDSLTLDRIDVDGNYTPENCRWATPEEQSNNKRHNIVITYKGKTQTAAQWSRELGLVYPTIISRYHKGLPPELILKEVV